MLVGRAGFDPENIILSSLGDNKPLLLDPTKLARSQGIGYLLLVLVYRELPDIHVYFTLN